MGLEWSEVLEEEGIQVTEDVQRVRDRDGGGGEEEGAAGGVGESQEARGSSNSSRGTRGQQVDDGQKKSGARSRSCQLSLVVIDHR